LEERVGFVDIRGVRKEFGEFVRGKQQLEAK
jgi:hypothetical protein